MMPDKKLTDSEIKTCKNCVHFDICCEHWAYDTDGKCTADDYKKNMANKVPCANHFKPVAEIKSESYKEFAERLKFIMYPSVKLNCEDIDNLLKELVGDTDA